MHHRHVTTTEWTLDAIDSALERGDLSDWRELFAAARADDTVAEKILHIARSYDMGGASVLARELCLRIWPDLK